MLHSSDRDRCYIALTETDATPLHPYCILQESRSHPLVVPKFLEPSPDDDQQMSKLKRQFAKKVEELEVQYLLACRELGEGMKGSPPPPEKRRGDSDLSSPEDM